MRTLHDTDTLESRLSELERRLAEHDDEARILEVIARYGFYADLGRVDDYLDLFTPDGALDFDPGRHPHRYEGRDSLRSLITGTNHKAIEGSSQHNMTGPMVVFVDGDSATAEGYSTVFVNDGTGFYVYSASFNRWTLERTGAGWRIRQCYRRRVGAADQSSVFARVIDGAGRNAGGVA